MRSVMSILPFFLVEYKQHCEQSRTVDVHLAVNLPTMYCCCCLLLGPLPASSDGWVWLFLGEGGRCNEANIVSQQAFASLLHLEHSLFCEEHMREKSK